MATQLSRKRRVPKYRSNRELRFETNDSYVLTAADITKGSCSFALSHKPLPESLKLWWRVTVQEPTEYTIDYLTWTVTFPLGPAAAAGDRVWAHYAYYDGFQKDKLKVGLTLVGTNGFHDYNTVVNRTSIALPASIQPGDLIAFGAVGDVGTISSSDSRLNCPDPRMTLRHSNSSVGTMCRAWTGVYDGGSTSLAIDIYHNKPGQFLNDMNAALYVLRPAKPAVWKATVSEQFGPSGSAVPGLSQVSGGVGFAYTSAGIGGDYGWYWPGWNNTFGYGTYRYVTAGWRATDPIPDTVLSTSQGGSRDAVILGVDYGAN